MTHLDHELVSSLNAFQSYKTFKVSEDIDAKTCIKFKQEPVGTG